MNMKTKMTRSFELKVVFLLVAGGAGCSQVSRTPIIVPPEAVREWTYTSDGAAGPGRYLVRMTDGAQVWEVEFPDTAYGAEIKVPLKGGRRMRTSGDFEGETAADKELARERESLERGKSGVVEPGYERVDEKPGKKPAAATTAEKPAAVPKGPKPSRLLAIHDIRQLLDSKNHEVALTKLADLERYYPSDVEILRLKGTVYKRLGHYRLAMEAWGKVLRLNPDDEVTANARRALFEEMEQGKANKPESPDE
jgi:hypothetical protein